MVLKIFWMNLYDLKNAHNLDMAESSKHIQFLQAHHRVCGKRLERVTYSCTNHRSLLQTVYGLDTTTDDSDTHPPSFCNQCYGTAKLTSSTDRGPIQWSPHSETFCFICDVKQKGGRPKKRKSHYTGRPSSLSQHIITVTCQLPSFSQSQVMSEAIRADLTCTSCHSEIKNPVELMPCKSLVCSTCSLRLIDTASNTFVCPGCTLTHKCTTSSFTALSPIEERTIKDSVVKSYQCYRTVKLSSLDKTCDDHRQTSNDTTLSDIINRSMDSEPTALEKQVATSVVTRLLNHTDSYLQKDE